MFRRTLLTVCLMVSCVWCLTLVTHAANPQSASTVLTFKPVASISALMQGQMTFFKRINKALKDSNNPERSEVIGTSAEVLAELANVNRFNENKDDYRTWAVNLRDSALQLAGEAKKAQAADEGKMKALVSKMKESCTACHDAYQ